MFTYVVRRLLLLAFLFVSCDPPGEDELTLNYISVGAASLDLNDPSANTNLPVEENILISFSHPLDRGTVFSSIRITADGSPIAYTHSLIDNNKTVAIDPSTDLLHKAQYQIEITSSLRGDNGERFPGHLIGFETVAGSLQVLSWAVGDHAVVDEPVMDAPLNLSASINFSAPLDPSTVTADNIMLVGHGNPGVALALSPDARTLELEAATPLRDIDRYQLVISADLRGQSGETFAGFAEIFYTSRSITPKYPLISDTELLTKVQQQTFRYFWDFGHPVSGMARERNTSGDIVTTGGTGFGLMAIVVGIERGFITRTDGLERLSKILNFLTTADRYHGAWPHWMNGVTGEVVPFSANDNGGDLVETAFLVQGLLTVRQYLQPGVAQEDTLIAKINDLWRSVEWNWYTRGGQDVLFWHWSPTVGWAMNHPIRGHNETLITYVLATSSPTFAIPPSVYRHGYARDGAIANGKTFYGHVLPLGEDYGGPLFFAHYSFLGLDPRNLSDAYADYWQQNVSHTLINRDYAVDNPKNFVGYSADSWGLTASDNHVGYSAHSPLNDLGVISPTAALSSFPYAPESSMNALRFFYYGIGDRLWGEYGFKDAFNITQGWYADSYLAIDQGPIIVMIENYRSGLLWELFMSAPEVGSGLQQLGFSF